MHTEPSSADPDPLAPGNLRSTLIAAVMAAERSFEKDELAYLALTSKVEHPFRDRLAWNLQRHPVHDDLVVAREWRRADLALLVGGSLRGLIEAKALYSFDVHSAANRAKYLGYVRADLHKAGALAPSVPAFALVLLTHVDGTVPAHLRKHVVKYAAGINGRHGPSHTHDSAVKVLTHELSAIGGVAQHVPMEPGMAFDLTVRLDAWVVGPVWAASTFPRRAEELPLPSHEGRALEAAAAPPP